jgi:hypothetical protein
MLKNQFIGSELIHKTGLLGFLDSLCIHTPLTSPGPIVRMIPKLFKSVLEILKTSGGEPVNEFAMIVSSHLKRWICPKKETWSPEGVEILEELIKILSNVHSIATLPTVFSAEDLESLLLIRAQSESTELENTIASFCVTCRDVSIQSPSFLNLASTVCNSSADAHSAFVFLAQSRLNSSLYSFKDFSQDAPEKWTEFMWSLSQFTKKINSNDTKSLTAASTLFAMMIRDFEDELDLDKSFAQRIQSCVVPPRKLIKNIQDSYEMTELQLRILDSFKALLWGGPKTPLSGTR